MRVCSVGSCGKRHYARGFCRPHYNSNLYYKKPHKCGGKGCERIVKTKSTKCSECSRLYIVLNPKEYLTKKYNNMRSRVSGKNKRNAVYYKNLPIVSKEEFLDWALNDPEFHGLYKNWKLSGFQLRLSPSIERIDPDKGYTFDNMEFITMSENSRRAMETRWSFAA